MSNAVKAETPPALRIFPLHGIEPGPACTCPLGASCERIGKHPMVRWREYAEDNVKGPSGGYGIQTGAFNGIFVVDLDRKNDKDGIAALLELAAGRPIPDTLGVHTPSGGVHLYFRLPGGASIPTSHSVLAPGVDIQGEGSFVVGPGSPHKSGGIYTEEPGELADPPDWLLQLIAAHAKPPAPPPSEHRVIDPESAEGVRAVAWAKAYLAKAEPAVEGQGGSNVFFAVCCHLMYSALPLDVLQHLIEEFYNPRCSPEWTEREIAHKLADADRRFEEPRGLCSPDFLDKLAGRTKNTDPREPDPLHEYTFHVGMRGSGDARKASVGEIAADLFDHKDWAGVLMFNAFRNRVVAVNPPMPMKAETPSGLQDNDVQLVRIWLEYHGKKCNVHDVRAAIEAVARQRTFHPIQEMLLSLQWDGVPRLDRVLPVYFQTAEGPYELAIGPRWFISLVARAMDPGCQSDCTLILEGEQGVGKSRAFRSLMRDPTWYAASSSGVDQKDFLENLRGVWLVGFDELASLTKASLTKVKTLLTELSDKYRPSYGRYSEDYPRSCGFCGSTNASQYLNDPTGARRFWPVRALRDIDFNLIVRDRDQLWAEAFVRWRAGEVWHIDTPELRALCEAEQEERLELDDWEEIIKRWFNDPTKFSRTELAVDKDTVFKGLRPFDGSRGVTTADVLEHAIGKLKGQWTNGDTQRVGRILRRLKMNRVKFGGGGGGKYGQEWRYVFTNT